MNSRNFKIGDRVERRLLKPHGQGTVVKIVQADPEVVVVEWDSQGPPRIVTQELSERLILLIRE